MPSKNRSPKRQAAIDAAMNVAAQRLHLYQAHAGGMSWEDAAKVAMGQAPAKKKMPMPPRGPFFPQPSVPAPKDKPKAEEYKPEPVKATFEPPEVARTSLKVDDLTKIRGIGSGTVRRLSNMGVDMFAQIAGWSRSDIEKFDAELGYRGRIDREDWVGQAKALLAEEAGE